MSELFPAPNLFQLDDALQAAGYCHVSRNRALAIYARGLACQKCPTLAGIPTGSIENGVVGDAITALRELVEDAQRGDPMVWPSLDRALVALMLVTPRRSNP